MCQHWPSCPSPEHPDRFAARIVAAHPEQGWNLLCNGVISFDDAGALLPSGGVVTPGQITPGPISVVTPGPISRGQPRERLLAHAA
jgi:hypothetical protein